MVNHWAHMARACTAFSCMTKPFTFRWSLNCRENCLPVTGSVASAAGGCCAHAFEYAEPALAADFSGRVARAVDESKPEKGRRPACLRGNGLSASSFWMECVAIHADREISVCPRAQARALRQVTDKAAEHNLAAILSRGHRHVAGATGRISRQDRSYHEKPEDALSSNSEQAETWRRLDTSDLASAGRSPDPLQGADPKDKIEISNILHEGMIAVEDGRYSEAIPLLQHVLDDSPAIPPPRFNWASRWPG